MDDRKSWMMFCRETGEILGVTWKKPIDGDFFEISTDIAESFMTGHERYLAFRITIESGQPTMVAIDETPKLIELSMFKKIVEVPDNLKTVLNDDCMTIFIEDILTIKKIFATIKNDPTWLIKTWNIDDLKRSDHLILIQLPQINRYSFYVSQ